MAKHHIDYKVSHGMSNIRRENWTDFIDIIVGTKKNKIAILNIHFNNFGNTKKLLTYLAGEKNQIFDIVIIENSTKQEEKEKLKIFCESQKNITLITPTHNIGSAGGYALGMEYIIQQQYAYFFIVEDDVIFPTPQVFSDMIDHADEKTLTFIHGCKNTRASDDQVNKGRSRRVQIAGYPVIFIEKIGIIDPRYFFRGEDLERGGRIERGIKQFSYQTDIINHDYFHPYLKSANGNYARFYFSIRNQLLSLKKDFMSNYILLVTLFFYMRTGITKIFVEKDKLIFKSFYDAIRDFIQHDYSFTNNQKKIALFIQNNKTENHKRINAKELSEDTKELYSNSKILMITGSDKAHIAFSTKIGNLRRHGLLISSSSTIFYPLSLLAPNIICINEYNLIENTISVTHRKNRKTIQNIPLIIISLVASLGLIVIVDIIIMSYIKFSHLNRRGC